MAFLNPQSAPIQPGFNDVILSGFDATYQNTTLVQAYANDIINKYGDQGQSDFLMLTSLGGRRGIANDTYYGWERGFYDRFITSNQAVTAGSAGAAITFNLAAGDVTTPLGKTFVRIGDILLNNANMQRLYVSNIVVTSGVAAVTASPLGGASVTAAVAVGDTLAIIGNAFAEGVGQPESIQTTWFKYLTRTQILKDTYSLSGSQDTNQPQWFQGPEGSFFSEGAFIAEHRMIKKMATTMIYGQLNNNAGIPVRTTTGLDIEIGNRGYTLPYGATVADFGREDLRAIATEMQKRWGGNLYLTWLPMPMLSAINDSLFNDLSNGNLMNAVNRLVADNFVGGDMKAVESLSTTFGWNAVNIDGTMFVLKNLRVLNDPQGVAASSTGKPQSTGYVVPMNKTENRETGDLASHIELVYKSRGGVNRLFDVNRDGKSSPVKIGQFDINAIYYLAEYGWMFRGLERFSKLVTS
jgi:hypothetical protein